MTHDELVKLAAAWLKRKRCSVIVTELTGGASEQADAIGWYGTFTTIIEAKASYGDYRADQQKHFRFVPEMGLGDFRYYIIPRELLEKVEPSLSDKWGLLVVKDGKVAKIKDSEYFEEHNLRGETGILLSVIKRISEVKEPFRGANIVCYKYKSSDNPKATLFVEEEE